MKVSVLVPTRQRYEKLDKCLRMLFENTIYPDYEVVVITDVDDPESFHIASSFGKRLNIRAIVHKKREMYVGKINAAYHATNSPLLAYIADDIEVQRGWLTEAVEVFKEKFSDGMGLVSFQDEFHERIAILAAHGLISRQFVRKFLGNNIFYPGYVHYWCDCELTVRTQRMGRYAHAKKAKIFHNRPNRLGKRDKIGQEGLTTKDRGRKLFLKRLWLGFPEEFPDTLELPEELVLRFRGDEYMPFYVGMRDVYEEKIDTRKTKIWMVSRETAEFLLSNFPLYWGSPYLGGESEKH